MTGDVETCVDTIPPHGGLAQSVEQWPFKPARQPHSPPVARAPAAPVSSGGRYGGGEGSEPRTLAQAELARALLALAVDFPDPLPLLEAARVLLLPRGRGSDSAEDPSSEDALRLLRGGLA